MAEDRNNQNDVLSNAEVMRWIMMEKTGEPNKYMSYWEDDSADVDVVDESELEKYPEKKILWAAENNHLDIVNSLLQDFPGMVNVQDKDGYTPLHRASYNGHLDMIKLLLSAGANIEAVTLDGWQPLHSACCWNNTAAASLLLQNGAKINAQTNGGQTPLHLAAAEQENRQTVELLLMNDHTDSSIKNSVGETAADISRRSGAHYYLFQIAEDSINELR